MKTCHMQTYWLSASDLIKNERSANCNQVYAEIRICCDTLLAVFVVIQSSKRTEINKINSSKKKGD